jgi:hypothetical protein
MKRFSLAIIMLCIASSAFAMSSKDTAGKTYVFVMVSNSDGTMSDTDTIVFDATFTKTELKVALTAENPATKKPNATQIVSFDDISIYRLATNEILHCLFDSNGMSRYCYLLPQWIEPEPE